MATNDNHGIAPNIHQELANNQGPLVQRSVVSGATSALNSTLKRVKLSTSSADSVVGRLPLEIWSGVFDYLAKDLAAIRSLSCVNTVFEDTVNRKLWKTVTELTIAKNQQVKAVWSVNNVSALTSGSAIQFLQNSVLPNAENVQTLKFKSIDQSSSETLPGDHLNFFKPDEKDSTTTILELFGLGTRVGSRDITCGIENLIQNVTQISFDEGFCAAYPMAKMIKRFRKTLKSIKVKPSQNENADLETSEEFWNALPVCKALESFTLSSFTFPVAFGHISAAILAEPKSITIPDAECLIEDFAPYEEALINIGHLQKLSLLERETSPKQVFMTWASDESWNTTLFEVLPKFLLQRTAQPPAPGVTPVPRDLEILEISPDFKGDLWDWFTLFPDLKELRLLSSFQNSPYGVDEQGVRRLLSHSINKYLMVHKGGAPHRKTLKVYGLQMWYDISHINPSTTEEGYKDLLQHMLSTFPTYFGPALARNMIRKVPTSSDWANEKGPLYICEDSNIFIEMYW